MQSNPIDVIGHGVGSSGEFALAPVAEVRYAVEGRGNFANSRDCMKKAQVGNPGIAVEFPVECSRSLSVARTYSRCWTRHLGAIRLLARRVGIAEVFVHDR
jgi:hypothetical protein